MLRAVTNSPAAPRLGAVPLAPWSGVGWWHLSSFRQHEGPCSSMCLKHMTSVWKETESWHDHAGVSQAGDISTYACILLALSHASHVTLT